MAATIQELSSELDQIKAGVDASKVIVADLKAQIAALLAQLGSGAGVTQADLDALDAKADAILAAQGGVQVQPIDQV